MFDLINHYDTLRNILFVSFVLGIKKSMHSMCSMNIHTSILD